MGLAAYGLPHFAELLRSKLLQLHDSGQFTVEPRYFHHHVHPTHAFGAQLETLLGPARPPGLPWSHLTRDGGSSDGRDQRDADIAASLQLLLEEALLGLVQELRRCTKSDALVFAGGVALNARANQRLLSEGGFARMFVQPAAGDAGGALGAALLAASEEGDGRVAPFRTSSDAALGLPLDAGYAADVARALGLRVSETANLASDAAARIASGQLVGFAQGRFEFGPRALGHRSLLAAPAPAAIRERINRHIKHREAFRPFAPAILAPATSRYFTADANDMTPWMTTTLPVSEESGTSLAAVAHRDGTSRLQTVAADCPLGDVLAALQASDHPPVCLNTSLNGPGEPICANAVDVLGFFGEQPLDALLLEHLVIEKP